MMKIFKMSILISLTIIFFAPCSTAVSMISGGGLSIGIDAGYLLSTGKWRNNRIAPDINQFKGSIIIGGEAELKLGRWGGLSVGGGYYGLSTKDWVDYVKSQGDIITGSAHIWHYDLSLKIYLHTYKFNRFKMILGLTLLDPGGNETFGPYNYDYDFLKRRIGYIIGGEYERRLNDNLSLTLQARSIWAPLAIHYADEVKYNIAIFPITLGVRFRP